MNKSRILIVEDEVIIAMELADRLKSLGYEVIRVVANGEMAINVALSEKPDLILMDIMIQGSMDGIETATKILEKSAVPIIYLTANADEATLERAKVSDAFAYLLKPFDEKELNTTIEMSLYKHRMDVKLKQSEERYKSLVENSSIGIFRISSKGEILHCNTALIKLLGFKNAHEFLGRNFSEFLLGKAKKCGEIINLIISKGKVQRYKIALITLNNRKIPISLGGIAVKSDNNVTYIDGTIEDITAQIKYEKQLIIAKEKAEESDRLKTEFLAGMSHEIRTPVNTILNYLSLLNEDIKGSNGSKYDEIFTAINVGSSRLTRTIDSILNMAQFQSGTFDVYRTKLNIIDEILQSLYDEFKYSAKQKGLEFNLNILSEHTNILGDKYSLSQLFVNLVDNALKYTKEGHVNINVFNDKNGILSVVVEDSGIGIDEKFLPTLFKPFTQEEQGYKRKFDGNGLGLSLVKKYCELNDAIISVVSAKGKGTKFIVKFTQANKENAYKTLSENNIGVNN